MKPCLTHRVTAALIVAAGAAMLNAPAGAETPLVATNGAMTQHVALAGINLQNGADLAMVHERIHDAAWRLCKHFRDSRSIAVQETMLACMNDAIDAAEAQLNQAVAAAATTRVTQVAVGAGAHAGSRP